MKKLHVFISKTFLGPFVLTFFVSLFILLLQFLWKYIDDLVGKGLTLPVLGELLFYTSASLIPMALPLAILLASLMTFGNLGEHFELLALKSSGISLGKIMSPLMIFTVLISCLAFFFSNNVLPIANLKMRSLLYDIQQQRPELQIREGVFYNGIPNYSIKIGDKDHTTNLLKNIIIYDHSSGKGNLWVTRADSGYMRVSSDKRLLMLTLYNGFNYIELDENKPVKTYPFRRDKFKKEEFTIELVGFGLVRTDEDLFKNNFQMMNVQQLQYHEDSFLIERKKSTLSMFTNLRSQNYLDKYSITHFVDTTKNDSLKKSFHASEFYKSLQPQQKTMAITNALNAARETQNYISSEINLEDVEWKRIRRCQIEWHKKFTLSVACFIFFLIGAPLGAIIRKGGFGMPMVISIFFFIFYYVFSITGEKFVREGVIAPVEGMWISSVILLPIGIFLTYKATNDSTLMNIDYYLNSLKKIPVIKKLLSKSADNENPSAVQ